MPLSRERSVFLALCAYVAFFPCFSALHSLDSTWEHM